MTETVTSPRRVDAMPLAVGRLPEPRHEEPDMSPRKAAPVQYVDIPGIAAMLEVEQSTIRKYKAQGRLPEPDIMLGQSPGWTRETVEAWVASRPGQGVGGGRPRKAPAEPVTKASKAPAKKVPAAAAKAPAKRGAR